MNVRKGRWRVQRELDSILQLGFSMEVEREPSLPLVGEDRTEWLLWCCLVNDCSMQTANHRYNHNVEMARRQKESRKSSDHLYGWRKPKVRKSLR